MIVPITPGGAVSQAADEIAFPDDTALGLPTRSALLDPPVSVDHHGMARRGEESG